jgi:hypothetical protein
MKIENGSCPICGFTLTPQDIRPDLSTDMFCRQCHRFFRYDTDTNTHIMYDTDTEYLLYYENFNLQTKLF